MQTIESTVDAVEEHWILSGVDHEIASEMADELSDHLTIAVNDGKSFEDVIGHDLRAFANDWAEHLADRRTPAEQLRLVVIGAVSFAACTIGVETLFAFMWNEVPTVNPATTAIAGLIGGVLAVIAIGPTTSRLGPNTSLRNPIVVSLVFGLVCALFILGWLALTQGVEESWSIEVPRWLSAITIIYSLAIFLLPLWTVVSLKIRERSTD